MATGQAVKSDGNNTPKTFMGRFGKDARAPKGPVTVLEAQVLFVMCQNLDCKLDAEDRWKMVQNIGELRRVVKLFEQEKERELKRLLKPGQRELPVGSPERAKLAASMSELLGMEAGVTLVPIAREKWADSPNVPPQVLEAFEGRIIPD